MFYGVCLAAVWKLSPRGHDPEDRCINWGRDAEMQGVCDREENCSAGDMDRACLKFGHGGQRKRKWGGSPVLFTSYNTL